VSDGLGGESSRGLGEVEKIRRSAGCLREEQDKRRDGGRERGRGGRSRESELTLVSKFLDASMVVRTELKASGRAKGS